MPLIATEPTATTDTPADSAIVTNDGFFPDIDLTKLRDTMRLDGTVTAERLRDAAIDAILSTNDDLTAWKAAQLAAGVEKMADAPAPKIGGESVQIARYRTAVYRLAKADLTERYRDFDATKSGSDDAVQLEGTIDTDRRAARWAIRGILGVSRVTVDLI
jgi:hypothetical protein